MQYIIFSATCYQTWSSKLSTLETDLGLLGKKDRDVTRELNKKARNFFKLAVLPFHLIPVPINFWKSQGMGKVLEKEKNIKYLLTYCPSCHRQLGQQYKK